MIFIRLLIILILCQWSSVYGKDKKIDQLELQEQLQRFYTRFTERTLESLLRPSIVNDVKMREAAMSQYQLYDSEALKISTGPYPEVNLLDMLVFVKLNKLIVKKWWIPKVWGEKNGEIILQSFRDSEKDIDDIALKILSPEEVRGVNTVVLKWIKDNPKRHRVEKIRLADFSGKASNLIQAQEEGKGGFTLPHLLVDTRGAVQAVDQMVLVANRAIFLAQYLPTLARLQLRIGTQEVLDDISIRFEQSQSAIKSVKDVRPMVVSMSSLTKDLDTLAKDVSGLMKTFKKEFPDGINATGNLKEVHHIVDQANVLMNQISGMKSSHYDILTEIKKEFRTSLIFIAILMTVVGLLISVFWWTGSYIVKKRLLKHPKIE